MLSNEIPVAFRSGLSFSCYFSMVVIPQHRCLMLIWISQALLVHSLVCQPDLRSLPSRMPMFLTGSEMQQEGSCYKCLLQDQWIYLSPACTRAHTRIHTQTHTHREREREGDCFVFICNLLQIHSLPPHIYYQRLKSILRVIREMSLSFVGLQ